VWPLRVVPIDVAPDQSPRISHAGKDVLVHMGFSKRGDTYLRKLLVNGARAVVSRSSHSSWIERLLHRRHFFNEVVAALANKIASTSWAVLAKGKAFDQVKWNPIETAAA
jgi:transposase